MRCFIGVPLPDVVKGKLAKASECFSGVDARMNVIEEHNLHVTLLFLGDVENVSKVEESLNNVNFKSFKASVKGVGFFPSNGYIRVIHSPVIKGKSDFIDLFNKIVEKTAITPDEEFVPHVTLARVKFVKSTNSLSRACYDIKIDEDFDVDCFNLYTSKLTSKGSVYTVLKSFEASE